MARSTEMHSRIGSFESGSGFDIEPAAIEDIPFLVETIIQAEKSGTDILTYETIFGISEDEARSYLARILMEEIDGCELSISGFLLAKVRGKNVAAVSAWIEGSGGLSSSIIKGNLLKSFLPQKCINKALSLNHLTRDLFLEYTLGTIQIGVVYVDENWRGKGLSTLLLEKQMFRLKSQKPASNEAYVQVFGNNHAAIKSYLKAGFETIMTKEVSLPEAASLFPATTKVLMRKFI